MIKNIKSHSIGLFLVPILLMSMPITSRSQNSGRIVERTFCPRYSIVNNEIASKIDSVYTSMDSIWPVCLQGYMYYELNEDEVYNDNKLYYYLEAVKQYHSCFPLKKVVVTDKTGYPFLLLDEEEIESGCFKWEGDSVWVEHYYEQYDIEPNGRCFAPAAEDGDSVIAWHKFSFTLPNDVDSVWLSKRMHRVYSYKK